MLSNLKSIDYKVAAGIFSVGAITPYLFSLIKHLAKTLKSKDKNLITKTYAAV